jgi:nitrite reductase/ring-hydroxylating ferredoxin subunit
MPADESVSLPLIELPGLPPAGISELETVCEGEAISLILLNDEHGVRAFENVCPHAGRRLDWAPGKFLLHEGDLVCAHHGARFELREGRCLGGPCLGQSLRRLPVSTSG